MSALGSVSAMLGANAEVKNRLVVSLNWTGETSSVLDFTAKHVVDVNSFNILAGKIYKQRNSLMSFSAGLGLARVHTFDSRNGAASYTETTVGLPLSIQAYAIGFQAVGAGLNLYANLNTKQSTAGIHVSLALGRISTRQKHN